MYQLYFKRFFDLFITITAIVVLAPIFIIISILLFISNRGQSFFTQERPGKNEKLFYIIKFKTMRDKFDEKGEPLPDFERITKLGKFIRKTSLDEIPQLLNVLKGDMSIVGPRPLLTMYLPLYNEEQKKRHLVRPGITGLAQINGRNAISWNDRFSYDTWYVNNISFKTDLKILYKTVLKVFKSEGIEGEKEPTLMRFKGDVPEEKNFN